RTLPLSTAAILAASAAVLGLGAPASAAPDDDMQLLAASTSLLSDHFWYRQTYQGHPVLGGFYARHVDTRTGHVAVTDGRARVGALSRTLSAVTDERARSVAAARTGGQPFRSELVVLPGDTASPAWDVLR